MSLICPTVMYSQECTEHQPSSLLDWHSEKLKGVLKLGGEYPASEICRVLDLSFKIYVTRG